VGNYLRAHLSDRVIPRICTATPIGKMDWHTSGWAVEPVAENDNFIWIRSPYTPVLQAFAPIANELDNIRVNAEGTIDIQYMAQIGDRSLFLGSHGRKTGGGAAPIPEMDTDAPMVRAGEKIAPSIVATGSSTVSRVHETRVEIDAACGDADLAYIRNNDKITDVVIVGENDAVDALFQIRRIVRALEDMPPCECRSAAQFQVQLCAGALYAGGDRQLAGLNRLTMVSPLRLEIETQFLVADQLQPVHTRLTRLLNNRGITVYCNTPLLGRHQRHCRGHSPTGLQLPEGRH
jgi:lysine 2,3-aminomutase